MTNRKTADTITDDELDALYEQNEMLSTLVDVLKESNRRLSRTVDHVSQRLNALGRQRG